MATSPADRTCGDCPHRGGRRCWGLPGYGPIVKETDRACALHPDNLRDVLRPLVAAIVGDPSAK